MSDIAHELSFEIRHRGKDATGDDVAFDLGEPEFNLVEPGRLRRGKVQMHSRVLGEERLNPRGLVRREVVGDHMNLLAGGWFTTRSVRKATNSAEVWRAAVLPNTSPVLVLNAAYRERVP